MQTVRGDQAWELSQLLDSIVQTRTTALNIHERSQLLRRELGELYVRLVHKC